MQFVIVTGLSGSGKSCAMNVLEDIGFYCIDNLPPQLISKFVEICRDGNMSKVALAVTSVPVKCSQRKLSVLSKR